jgi:hypothetical protein
MKRKIPLLQALSWIAFSTVLISGGAFICLKQILGWRLKQDERVGSRLVRLVQTGPQKEALQTSYLAELMDLSIDRPSNLSHFDEEKAVQKLLRSPVIKEASVKVMKPGTLYVDYTVRQPCAKLYEYDNVALDQDGHLFPLHPFFSPKNLPELYLGFPFFVDWQQAVQGKEIELCLNLLKTLSQSSNCDLFQVRLIDVSNAFADSYGVREIVLHLEDEVHIERTTYILPRLLRLSTKNYPKELGNYLKLREQLLEKESKLLKGKGEVTIRLSNKTIDLRISQLAFIDGK